jgi:hypothetical protein
MWQRHPQFICAGRLCSDTLRVGGQGSTQADGAEAPGFRSGTATPSFARYVEDGILVENSLYYRQVCSDFVSRMIFILPAYEPVWHM